MKKIIITVYFILFVFAHLYAETIEENGAVIEYEISGKDIYVKVIIKELKDPYEIHIFIDDKINPEYKDIGFVSTHYFHYQTGGSSAIYYIKTNTIDEICLAITADLQDKRSKKINALISKSNFIIKTIKMILVESGLCV